MLHGCRRVEDLQGSGARQQAQEESQSRCKAKTRTLKERSCECRTRLPDSEGSTGPAEVWLFDKLKHKRAPVYARMMELAVALYFFVVMLAVEASKSVLSDPIEKKTCCTAVSGPR